MQYTENFLIIKMKIFTGKKIDIILIFAQRGGSNEYPQFMFWSENKKNRYTPVNPSFAI